MFVRRKRSRNRVTYQVVENYRLDGKVRQRVIMDIGKAPSVQEAIADLQTRMSDIDAWMARCRHEVAELSKHFPEEPVCPIGSLRGYGEELWLARFYWSSKNAIPGYERLLERYQERLNRLQELADKMSAKA